MKKVLVTDDAHPLLIAGLEKLAYVIDFQPKISLANAYEIMPEYFGVIINSKMIMGQKMLDRATNLKFIGRLGSGLDIIDLAYAKKKNIAVFSAPNGNANAVAEHALGMLLMLANHLNYGNQEVKNFDWNREKNRGFELSNKTIGIIGVGNNGTAFAKKLSGMGMNVLAYDKYKENFANGMPHVKECSLEEIQKEADIVSLHVQLTPETTYYIDNTFIENCKKPIFVINTSRGKNVNTLDLIKGLQDGKVLGACLDVFENEKTATYSQSEKQMYQQLFDFQNVLVTPHVAGWTVESKIKIAQVLLDQIKDL